MKCTFGLEISVLKFCDKIKLWNTFVVMKIYFIKLQKCTSIYSCYKEDRVNSIISFYLIMYMCWQSSFIFFSVCQSAVPKFSHERTPKIVFHILRSPHLRKHSLGRSCRRGVQFSYWYIIAGCQYFQLLDRNSCDILRDIWNFSWHFKIHAF